MAFGFTTMDAPMGLPRVTESLCPECRKVISARMFEKGGEVWMEKTCSEHGSVEDKIDSDAALYLRREKFAFWDGDGIENPKISDATSCPDDCGLCNMHHSTASLTNIDLTNRCNLKCPYCFANANAQSYVYEPSLTEIKGMLDQVADVRPKRQQGIQFSGGEPTLHPHFLEAVSYAKELGFISVQIATNGITLAQEKFAKKAAEAGLRMIYLQFDGTFGGIYQKTRGVDIWKIKQKAVENCRKFGITVTLVPTLVKGVNDHQVGDIIKFAMDNIDTVVAISFQPVAFTGRIDYEERMAGRYTLSDLAHGVEDQTGFVRPDEWYPFPSGTPITSIINAVVKRDKKGFGSMSCSCHPDCGMNNYLLFNPSTGEHIPLSRVIDLEAAYPDLVCLAKNLERKPSRVRATASLIRLVMKYYRPKNAPKSLTFFKLIQCLDALSGHRLMKVGKKKRYEWRMLFLAAMHFQDSYNYQVERVKRCVIHYSAPDGHIYPFCTYNSGPIFREKVEKRMSVSKEEWKAKKGGQFVSEGFYGEDQKATDTD